MKREKKLARKKAKMRCDQFMGITKEAEEFLASVGQPKGRERTGIQTYAWDAHEHTSIVLKNTYSGMFGDEYPHYCYKWDAGWAVTYLQADPWASGPVFFLGLLVMDPYNSVVKKFEWTDEEIQANL
jgi:hypothetical protein